ncbi:sulfate transporter family protein [soil metagenome]
MISSAFRAFHDLLSPPFRRILLNAILLTLLLFAAVIVTAVIVLHIMTFVPWGWAEPILDVAAGLGLLVLSFFLMAPVTAMFAGFYLDRVAGLVEAAHYPADPPGRELPFARAVLTGIQFGLLVLAVNILVLPTVFFGIGAAAILLANAYLISREYFEMAASRHMPIEEARHLRKENSPAILVAGFLPAFLALIPFVNLTVPLFATSYFVHLFKRLQRSSA